MSTYPLCMSAMNMRRLAHESSILQKAMLLEVADITRSLIGFGGPDIHYWYGEKKTCVYSAQYFPK